MTYFFSTNIIRDIRDKYEVWASAISLLQLTQSVVLEGKYVQKLSFDLQASDRQMYKKIK